MPILRYLKKNLNAKRLLEYVYQNLKTKNSKKTTALLKQECADFIVKEDLGYEMSGEGEFVAVKIRKTDCNTLFVGEKLAKFAGISDRNMGDV